MSHKQTAQRLVLLNTSIISGYGSYDYQPITLADARALVQEFLRDGKPLASAIGHQSTAELLAELLNCQVPLNRTEFAQTVADLALVFKLKQRPPEGKVLNRAELEECGYEFALLTKTS